MKTRQNRDSSSNQVRHNAYSADDFEKFYETVAEGIRRDILLLTLCAGWLRHCDACQTYAKGPGFDQLHKAAGLAENSGFNNGSDEELILGPKLSPITFFKTLCETVIQHPCTCPPPNG